MLGLRWVDVDFERGLLRVHQALQRVGKKLRFVEPKSERSRRVVALPSFAIEALKRQQEHQRGDHLLAGSRWVDGGLVFTTIIGTPLDERNVRRVFKAVLKSAELPAIRIHDLRHTTATLLPHPGSAPARRDGDARPQPDLSDARHLLACVARTSGRVGCKRLLARMAVRMAVKPETAPRLTSKSRKISKEKW
jgi:hypothetical protein